MSSGESIAQMPITLPTSADAYTWCGVKNLISPPRSSVRCRTISFGDEVASITQQDFYTHSAHVEGISSASSTGSCRLGHSSASSQSIIFSPTSNNRSASLRQCRSNAIERVNARSHRDLIELSSNTRETGPSIDTAYSRVRWSGDKIQPFAPPGAHNQFATPCILGKCRFPPMFSDVPVVDSD